MLVLKRKDGDWLTITHEASGDRLRIRVQKIQIDPRQADLVFDDAPRKFTIERDERAVRHPAPVRPRLAVYTRLSAQERT
jgi:sRNA-binding carbon storage regulator CsrA